jgi:hypothetical protein
MFDETAMRFTHSALLLILIPMSTLAASPPASAEREEKLARARQLREEAQQIEQEANARYTAEAAECYKKFLVSDCLAERKKEQSVAARDAKNRSIQAGELEREVKRADVEAKEAKKAAEAPDKAAEQQAHVEQYRAEEARKSAMRSEKLAEKRKQAAEGRKAHEAEEAARAARNEERARDDEERAAKRKARAERPVPVPLN